MDNHSNHMVNRLDESSVPLVDSKPAKKATRTWKKPKDMPKRPLSAYNLFFAEERKRLIEERQKASENNHSEAGVKLGFANLARSVANRWKLLSIDERRPFLEIAAKEKAKYKILVKKWRQESGTRMQRPSCQATPDNSVASMCNDAGACCTDEVASTSTCSVSYTSAKAISPSPPSRNFSESGMEHLPMYFPSATGGWDEVFDSDSKYPGGCTSSDCQLTNFDVLGQDFNNKNQFEGSVFQQTHVYADVGVASKLVLSGSRTLHHLQTYDDKRIVAQQARMLNPAPIGKMDAPGPATDSYLSAARMERLCKQLDGDQVGLLRKFARSA